MSPRSLERVHERARAHGPQRLYRAVRALASVVLRSWFRIRIAGAEHVPDYGAAISSPSCLRRRRRPAATPAVVVSPRTPGLPSFAALYRQRRRDRRFEARTAASRGAGNRFASCVVLTNAGS